MNETSDNWRGDIWAGFTQTENWSSELDASRERLLLRGPRNMQYILLPSQVQEIIPAIGKFLFWTWRLRRSIRIVHNRSDIPEKLTFLAKKTQTTVMLERLKNLGYKVGN